MIGIWAAPPLASLSRFRLLGLGLCVFSFCLFSFFLTLKMETWVPTHSVRRVVPAPTSLFASFDVNRCPTSNHPVTELY